MPRLGPGVRCEFVVLSCSHTLMPEENLKDREQLQRPQKNSESSDRWVYQPEKNEGGEAYYHKPIDLEMQGLTLAQGERGPKSS